MIERPSLTIGIEEEYQIVDPETRQLRSFITQFLEGDRVVMVERDLKPELHQSMVELGTPICHTLDQAKDELIKQRSFIVNLAAQKDLAVIECGHLDDLAVTDGDPAHVPLIQDMGLADCEIDHDRRPAGARALGVGRPDRRHRKKSGQHEPRETGAERRPLPAPTVRGGPIAHGDGADGADEGAAGG